MSGWGNWNCEFAKAELEIIVLEAEKTNGLMEEQKRVGIRTAGKKTPVLRRIECRWLRMMN